MKEERFSSEQLQILYDILGLIIPSSDEYLKPSASIILEDSASLAEEFILLANSALHKIQELSILSLNNDWGKLENEEKIGVINLFQKKENRLFTNFCLCIINAYYTNALVLKAINTKSIPPFPEGNQLKEFDYLMLENVFLKGEIYRKTE
jgi:hypothetical protein